MTEQDAIKQLLTITDSRISLAVRKDFIRRVLRELKKNDNL